MKNIAGEKVNKIINEEFDGRVAMAVVTYILDEGFDNYLHDKEEYAFFLIQVIFLILYRPYLDIFFHFLLTL